MVLGECRPKYFNILIYFNIKMFLEECRPKYCDIQMVRGESCSIYLVERSSSSNSTIYSIVRGGGALWHISNNISLGGGFKCLIFSLLFGEDFQFDYIILRPNRDVRRPDSRAFWAVFSLRGRRQIFFWISRSIFFLRFQPIKCIRLKSIWRANSTCSFGTSNTILFKCCQHFKESRTAMQPCSC